MTASIPRWYALHVRARHEKYVSAQLVAKQHDSFLPLYAARHKWADRIKSVALPLFPGYVFCKFESRERSSVIATSGVIDIVRRGADLAPIEDLEIESIQRVVNSPLCTEPYSRLAQGQRVMMSGGPLNGLTGTLIEVRKDLRLVLSVELLQRSVLVEIDRDWVIPCEPVASVGVAFQNDARTA